MVSDRVQAAAQGRADFAHVQQFFVNHVQSYRQIWTSVVTNAAAGVPVPRLRLRGILLLEMCSINWEYEGNDLSDLLNRMLPHGLKSLNAFARLPLTQDQILQPPAQGVVGGAGSYRTFTICCQMRDFQKHVTMNTGTQETGVDGTKLRSRKMLGPRLVAMGLNDLPDCAVEIGSVANFLSWFRGG
jgi:hypothetical protein